MALLDVSSPLVLNSGLDLFKVPPTDVSVENSFYEDFLPTSSLETSDTITFIIPKQYQHYIDLSNTLLYVKFKLTDKEGNDLPSDKFITTINNGLHSLFSYLEIYFNDTQIAGPISNSYPYLAYIKRLLYESKAVRDYKGTMALWDDLITNRSSKTINSRPTEAMDNIFSDIFQQEKYLIPGIEIKLKFQKNTNEFSLLSYFKDVITQKALSDLLEKGVKIKIMDMYVRLYKIAVHPQLQIAHETILKSGKPVKYIIDKNIYKYVQIEKGATNHRIENVFFGHIPPSFMLFLVDADAYNGSMLLDPYNFQHFNISEITVYVNNNILTNKPLKTDFQHNQFIEAYSNFLQTTGMLGANNFTNGITLDDYKNGKTIFFFNTTSDTSSDTHFDLVRNGNIRIELTFDQPLSKSVNVVLIASKPSIIKVDSNRNLTIED